jgi:hypothetical protein
MHTFRHKMIFTALAGIAAAGARQVTPCQLQQAGPTPNKIDELAQNLVDMSGVADQMIELITQSDAEKQRLRDEIAALVAADTALAAKVDAAFDASDALENKMRASVPGVPPVGGDPLLQSYNDKAAFDAAVAAYTGPERVTLDGADVKAGTDPALDYFTHSDDAGKITTVGPTS